MRARWGRVVARQLANWQTMKEILEHREDEIAECARQAVQRGVQETNSRPVSVRLLGRRRSADPSGRGRPGEKA